MRLCVDRFPFPVPSPGEETNGRKQIQIIVKYSVTRCTGGRGGDVGIKIPEALSVHPRVFFLLRGFRYFTSRVFLLFFWGGGAGETSGCGNSGIREEQATKNCEKDEKTKTFSGSFSNISRTLSAYMNVVLRSSYFMWFGYVWLKCVFVWKRRHPSKNGTFAPKCRPRLPPYLQLYMKLGRWTKNSMLPYTSPSGLEWKKTWCINSAGFRSFLLTNGQVTGPMRIAASMMFSRFSFVMFTSWGFNFGVTDLMDPFPPNTVFFGSNTKYRSTMLFFWLILRHRPSCFFLEIHLLTGVVRVLNCSWSFGCEIISSVHVFDHCSTTKVQGFNAHLDAAGNATSNISIFKGLLLWPMSVTNKWPVDDAKILYLIQWCKQFLLII